MVMRQSTRRTSACSRSRYVVDMARGYVYYRRKISKGKRAVDAQRAHAVERESVMGARSARARQLRPDGWSLAR